MKSKFNEKIMTKSKNYGEDRKSGWYSVSRINMYNLTRYLVKKQDEIKNEFEVDFRIDTILVALDCLAREMTVVNVIKHLNYRELSETMLGIISAKRLNNLRVLEIMEYLEIIHRNKGKECMINPILMFACKGGEPVKGQFTKSWDYVYGLYQNFKKTDVIDYTYYQADPEYASVANDPLEWSSYNKKRGE